MPPYISASTVFKIKPETALTREILLKLERASICLGKLNQFSSDVLEFDFIVEAIKNIEALNSARIEGTTGNLKDLYLIDTISEEVKKKLKLFSAVNYRSSISEVERITKKYTKIEVGLIRHLHKVLTENDPSTKGTPGKFREKDVKIANSRLGDFYPANHVKVPEFIDEFVVQVNKNDIPTLISVAIMHYQFEAIHPFEDGNGRTGRLLLTAKLIQNNIIAEPILNLSQYLEKHRDEYLAGLRSVSDSLSYETWVSFFLDAIIAQCEHNFEIIEKMQDIKSRNELKIRETVKGSPIPLHILRYALNNLFLTAPDVAGYLKSIRIPLSDHAQTAAVNIKRLVEMKILEKAPSKKGRAQVYNHRELWAMLRS